MKNLRKYGKTPFNVAVIHGGPGAPGHMAPVARELSSDWDVLEPLQTAVSLTGQVEELKIVLEKNGDLPVTLIGFSWGAWLSFIFAANYPAFVRKLILIGSGPFEEKYAAGIQETRLSRLSEEEKQEVQSLMEALNENAIRDKNKLIARFGNLFAKADTYDPLNLDTEDLEAQYHIYESVWQEASELRKSGKLLKLGKHVQCPVIAVHGDYDPHPAEGVKKPLAAVLKDFRFILLKNCGHMPWIEKEAREEFFRILKKELR